MNITDANKTLSIHDNEEGRREITFRQRLIKVKAAVIDGKFKIWFETPQGKPIAEPVIITEDFTFETLLVIPLKPDDKTDPTH